jgi:hypothetical protein
MKPKNKMEEMNCIRATPSCSSSPVESEINKVIGYIRTINYQYNLPEDFPNSK